MTHARPLLLGLVAGLALGSVSGCNVEPCTPQSCSGCCDDRGACQAGNEPAACGLAGSACINCGADVCNPNGTCFGTYLPAPNDGGLDDLLPDANFVDAGLIEEDAGVDAGEMDAGEVDAGLEPDAGLDAGLDAGAQDAGLDAGAQDAGLDAGAPDAGVDAGGFLPRDQCGAAVAVGVPDAGNWTDSPVLEFGGGRLLLAYKEYLPTGGVQRGLYQTRLGVDGGWGPVVSHFDSTYTLPRPGFLAVSAAGNVALVGQTGISSWARRAYSSQLDTWVSYPWANASSASDQTFVLATGPESFFHAWYGQTVPFYASVSPLGVSMETATSSSSDRATSAHAALMPDGDVALAWADGNKVLRGRFIAPTGLKMGGEALHAEPAIVGQLLTPVVTPTPSGDAYVFWERRNNDLTVQLMMTTLRDDPVMGPSFDAPTVLAQGTTAIGFGSIQPLVDSAGDLTVTWVSLDRSTRALRRVGGAWGTPVIVGPATDSAITTNRRAAIDREGHVTVIYQLSTPGRIEHRRIERGSSTWGPAVRVTPMGALVHYTPAALALDAADAPVIAWRESSAASPIFVNTCR